MVDAYLDLFFTRVTDAHEDTSLLFASTRHKVNTLGYYHTPTARTNLHHTTHNGHGNGNGVAQIDVRIGGETYSVYQRLDYQTSGTGVTGGVLWSTTPVLLTFLTSSGWFTDTLTRGKSVILELGSGVGVTPKVLGPLCRRFIASDHDTTLLKLIRKNGRGVENLSVVELDWTDAPATYLRNLTDSDDNVQDDDEDATGVDVQWILCFDCIYSSYLAGTLVRSLHAIMRQSPLATALVGQQMRDESVHLEFLEHALEYFDIWRFDPNDHAVSHADMVLADGLDGYGLFILKLKA